jgi:hypothetical protein
VQSATGCDRLYVGRSMADSHRGMGLSAKDWDRTVDLLRATMTEFTFHRTCRPRSSRSSDRHGAASSSVRPTNSAAARRLSVTRRRIRPYAQSALPAKSCRLPVIRLNRSSALCLLLMLWTAPPPAHQCHGCGCC